MNRVVTPATIDMTQDERDGIVLDNVGVHLKLLPI
jgi:hypothetical protein